MGPMNRLLKKILMVVFAVFWCNPAAAWSYLEHSFLTDRSCYEVLKLTEHELSQTSDSDNQSLSAKYIALGLLCPTEWHTEYCVDRKKESCCDDDNIIGRKAGLLGVVFPSSLKVQALKYKNRKLSLTHP